jgi:hypothetical protein
LMDQMHSCAAMLSSPGLELSRYAGRLLCHSACTSRPSGSILLAQLKPKVVRKHYTQERAVSVAKHVLSASVPTL